MRYMVRAKCGEKAWEIVGSEYRTIDGARKAGLKYMRSFGKDIEKMRVEIVRMSKEGMVDVGYMLYNTKTGVTYNGMSKVNTDGSIYTPRMWK